MSLNFHIPDSAWHPICDGDDAEGGHAPDSSCRLKTTIHVNGLMFHVEAIEVKDAEDGNDQEGRCDLGESRFEAMHPEWSDSGFSTMKIHGRDYVVFMVPGDR